VSEVPFKKHEGGYMYFPPESGTPCDVEVWRSGSKFLGDASCKATACMLWTGKV
jgi:hypothetical protein